MLWLAVGLWTLLAAGLTWWLIDARLRDYRQQTLATANVRVKAIKETLAVSLRQLAALPLSLSHLAQVRDYVSAARKPALEGLSEAEQARLFESNLKLPAVQAMNTMFDSMARDFALPLVGLIDADGDLIASSVRRTQTGEVVPPIRNNLRARDYFSQAMAQGASVQFLMGRFTKAPGLYFSSRIEIDGKPFGVAVVKQDSETLNRLLSDPEGSVVFVSDVNGVVVLSNHSEFLLHRLPTAPERPEALLKTLYQAVPERLQWSTAQLPAATQAVTATTIKGLRHVTLSSPLGALPFTVWVLDPLENEPVITASTLSIAALLWLLGSVLIGMAWRGSHWLDDALQARRDLLDMAQALPLTVFRYVQPAGSVPGRFAFLGRGVRELFGVEPRALDDDPLLPWRLAGDTSKHPPTEAVEFPVRNDAGATWLLAHSTPQPQPDGSTVYNGYWLDVSSRRAAEVRFAALFEHAPNALLFFDRKRGTTHCNPATLLLFGATEPSQILGHVVWFPGLSPTLQADGRESRERIIELMRNHHRDTVTGRLAE